MVWIGTIGVKRQEGGDVYELGTRRRNRSAKLGRREVLNVRASTYKFAHDRQGRVGVPVGGNVKNRNDGHVLSVRLSYSS